MSLFTAPADYEGTVQIVEFSGPGVHTFALTINEDQKVEPSEYFTVHITAGDSFVTLNEEDISVEIVDTSGECHNQWPPYIVITDPNH